MVVAAAALERRLFEVLGAWAPEAAEPEAKVLFRVHSFQHARHAELLEAGGWDRGDGALSPIAALVEEVAAGPADTVARLSGIYRNVLPALIDLYRDAPDAVVAEDEEALRDGQRLLAELSASEGATGRADR